MSDKQQPPAAAQPPARAADLISRSFQAVRAEAKKRRGYVPDLSRQRRDTTRRLDSDRADSSAMLQRMGLDKSSSTPRSWRLRRGSNTVLRATGPDGRALRRARTFSSVGEVLSEEITARGWGKDLANGWVQTHWPELVGPTIAGYAVVERVKGTTVYVRCSTTPQATNLRAMQRMILAKIAEKVGPNVVTTLKIHGPEAPSWRHGPLHVKGRGPRDTYG
ncbi:DciA family protein [Corynebacterium sp. TAE3-ERU30]|uniref:DciA family protein n=1 Tax=Corynebacterium sp. TAE3-ERU30 TaxID=2849496 RepID=UPI00351D0B31